MGVVVLQALGLGEIAGGVVSIGVAIDHINRATPSGVVGLFAGGGLALVLSGILTVARRRRQLIERVLGTVAAATYALALALVAEDGASEVADGLLVFAEFFAGCALLTVVFGDLIRPES